MDRCAHLWGARNPVSLASQPQPTACIARSDVDAISKTVTYQTTRKFLNCQGSDLSRSSGKRSPRPCSGVQSLYLPTTGPR